MPDEWIGSHAFCKLIECNLSALQKAIRGPTTGRELSSNFSYSQYREKVEEAPECNGSNAQCKKEPGKSQLPYRGCCDLEFSCIYYDPSDRGIRCKQIRITTTPIRLFGAQTTIRRSPSRPKHAKSLKNGPKVLKGSNVILKSPAGHRTPAWIMAKNFRREHTSKRKLHFSTR